MLNASPINHDIGGKHQQHRPTTSKRAKRATITEGVAESQKHLKHPPCPREFGRNTGGVETSVRVIFGRQRLWLLLWLPFSRLQPDRN